MTQARQSANPIKFIPEYVLKLKIERIANFIIFIIYLYIYYNGIINEKLYLPSISHPVRDASLGRTFRLPIFCMP